jgi:hypothetical protein
VSSGAVVDVGLMTLGAKVYAFAGQRVVNTVTTNIPGPQQPLYLLGHRMLELFPYIPVAQTVRISIGIVVLRRAPHDRRHRRLRRRA